MPDPADLPRWYHRLSNATLARLFGLLPMPRGFVLLTVTGRRSGVPRRRPVRAVRRDNTFYAVALLGERSDWLRNVRKEPQVRVKAGGRTRAGVAREITEGPERETAAELYTREVVPYDYVDYPSVHWSFPTRGKIVDSHRRWVENGVLVAIDLTAEEEA